MNFASLAKKSNLKRILNFHRIHLSEISIFTKFTFLKSHFSQNSRFWNLNFRKIHVSEISIFTKFIFLKYQNQGIFWIKRSVLPQCAQGSLLNGDFRMSSFAFWYATYRVAFKKRGNHEETCCILRSARFFKNQLVLEERSLKNGSSSRKCVIFLSVFSRGRKLHYRRAC